MTKLTLEQVLAHINQANEKRSEPDITPAIRERIEHDHAHIKTVLEKIKTVRESSAEEHVQEKAVQECRNAVQECEKAVHSNYITYRHYRDYRDYGNTPFWSGEDASASQIPAAPNSQIPSAEPTVGPSVVLENWTRLNESMINRVHLAYFNKLSTGGEKDSTGREICNLGMRITYQSVITQHDDYICRMTRDFSNFKKYIQPEFTYIIEEIRQVRAYVKKKFGRYPWIGKFHLNLGAATGRQSNIIEQETAAAMWWDNEDEVWKVVMIFHDFVHEFDLGTENTRGAVARCTWKNPKYIEATRDNSWANRHKNSQIAPKVSGRNLFGRGDV